ncbi:MAG: NAD(P)H-hydrate dehydratase [Akkermansia sp.]
MNITSNAAMRAAEQQLFDSGKTSALELMNLAIERLHHAWSSTSPDAWRCYDKCIVYAGHGNNAGDAMGLAAQLGVPVILRHTARFSEDSQVQLQKLRESGYLEGEELPADLGNARLLIIDGLLGTGARGPLRPPYDALVVEINELRSRNFGSCTLAIDIPTGLEGDGACVQADITACLGAVKEPLLADSATASVGRLLPIPLPEVELPLHEAQLITATTVAPNFKRRPVESYKNSVGHLHIIAGSRGYIGAAQLCAEAALHAGAGLITLYCLPDIYDILAVRLAPEIMLKRVESYADIDLSKANALLIGPGLGQPNTANRLALKHIVESTSCPMLIDADGLNLMARDGWRVPAHAVLTPHVGEMTRLAGSMTSTRLAWAKDFIALHPCTLLLKGARTLIASPKGIAYNSNGGSFMANGGQGDCLAGVIASFLSQGTPQHEAACTGAWLCGHAAEEAWQLLNCPLSVTASQVIDQLQEVMRNVR